MAATAQELAAPPDEQSAKPSDWGYAWVWVPTLYFAQGVPNEVVVTLAGVMYALLGVSNDKMTLYTGLMYLPWVVKPLWSPLVDVIGTQRRWVLATQLALAVGCFGVAAALPTSWFFFATLCFFWWITFSSATHDIAADGFYMSGLTERSQAWFVGIRSTAFRGAKFFVAGAVLALAGEMSKQMPKDRAWAITFCVIGGIFVLLSAYHAATLPAQRKKRDSAGESDFRKQLVESVTTFFRKPGIVSALAFLLLFRFAEAQLGALTQPFLLADRSAGGMGFDEQQVALIYGTGGIATLTIGGIIGGIAIANQGLRRWLLPMALALNAPNAFYYLLAWRQPEELWVAGAVVAIEMFGYGFGFAAYLMYMLRFSRGNHQTAHYALCTGLMALGMMLPRMPAGEIQESLGYENFFLWILLATIPSFLVTWIIRSQFDDELIAAEESSG